MIESPVCLSHCDILYTFLFFAMCIVVYLSGEILLMNLVSSLIARSVHILLLFHPSVHSAPKLKLLSRAVMVCIAFDVGAMLSQNTFLCAGLVSDAGPSPG